jgi:hypothetical protein
MRTRVALAVFLYASGALAQPFKEAPDAAVDAAASTAASASAVPPPVWPRAPEPSATTSSSSAPRPDPGPGLRERGGRTRRANPASGVVLVFIIVAALGWYVVKRIRRF